MKFPPLALAAALILSLAACGPAPVPSDTPTPAVSAEPMAAPTPTAPVLAVEPPLSGWTLAQPVPEFLNAEQQALFLHAYEAAHFLELSTSGFLEYYPDENGVVPALSGQQETVEIGGNIYTVSVGRFRRWEDFKAMMDGLFTADYQDSLLNGGTNDAPYPRFTSTEDGRLCYMDGMRGSNIDYGFCDTPDSYELVSQSEDEIIFNLIGHYANLETAEIGEEGQPHPTEEYTLSYPIRMERTDAGWRVAEFHLPY